MNILMNLKPMARKRINVGCGKDYKKGWINLDFHNKNGADLVFDLNDICKGKKLPYEDNHFDFVYCSHVIEDFVDPVPLIKELVRITKVNGELEFRVPNETCTWSNIHHKSAFNLQSFGALTSEDYGYGEFPILIKSEFYGNHGTFSKGVAYILNKIPRFIFYETPVRYLFPSTNIRFMLTKISNVKNAAE